MSVKVMIVDNIEPRRQAAEDTFRTAGFQVCSANDGFGCYLKLRSERPDLVILQTMLPMVSGLQVLQSLREGTQTRRLPVILLAEPAELESLSEVEAGHCDLYLPNSVSPDTLVAEATRMLANGEWSSPKDTDSSQPSGEGQWADRWTHRRFAAVRDSA